MPCNNFIQQYTIDNLELEKDYQFIIDSSFLRRGGNSNISIYYYIEPITDNNYPLFDCSSIVNSKQSVNCSYEYPIPISISYNSTKYDIKSTKVLITLYYEFKNNPEYAICNNTIDVMSDDKVIKFNKKILLLPWEISALDTSTLLFNNNSKYFDLRAYNSITRPDGFFPVNMKKISIAPVRLGVGTNMVSPYPTKYNPVTDDDIIRVDDKGADGYYMRGFLEFMYNSNKNSFNISKSNDNISYIFINTSTENHTVLSDSPDRYNQLNNKYPIWNRVSFDNIEIKKGIYKYSQLSTAPSNTNDYCPYMANGVLIDGITSTSILGNNYTIYSGFLCGAQWSIRKITPGRFTASVIIPTQTNIFKFSNLSGIENDPTNKSLTLYSLYWNINPRYVKSPENENYYNCTINLLKQPKVLNGEDSSYRYMQLGVYVDNIMDASVLDTQLVLENINTSEKDKFDGTNPPPMNGDTIITDTNININTNGKLDFVQTVDPNLR